MGKHGRAHGGEGSAAKRPRTEGPPGEERSGEEVRGEEKRGDDRRGEGRDSWKSWSNCDGLDSEGITWLNQKAVRSAKFDEYYAAQKLVDPAQYDEFLAVCNQPLPVTFRVNALHANAADVLKTLAGKYMTDADIGSRVGVVPWFPKHLVYQVDSGRSELRKDPAMKALHQWITMLNTNGAISRQELVSMIPPLILDVQAHHRVLDMCASPGSKTAQLLEMMHSSEMSEKSFELVLSAADGMTAPPFDGEHAPTGYVVANDKDSKRAFMLVHQTNRINSPNLVVTCHDASEFPKITDKSPDAVGTHKGSGFPGYFDRILCDVPCSGDGTVRKNVEIFRVWRPADGNGLHPLQVTIAMRGLQLLKIGGLMAYSTCSFNPLENEAVLAELLRRCGGAVELVDLSDQLPGLIRSPGMHTWTVFDNNLTPYESFEAAKASDSDKVTKLTKSMFPPPMHIATDRYHLEQAMRLLPHAQNTGGFFIALLRKTGPLPREAVRHKPAHWMDFDHEVAWPLPVDEPVSKVVAPAVTATTEDVAKAPASTVAKVDVAQPARPMGPSGGYGEIYNAVDKAIIEPLFRYYGIVDADSATSHSASVDASVAWRARPGLSSRLLLSRSAGSRALCVCANTIVQDCLPIARRPDNAHGLLKFVHTGLKTFECGLNMKSLTSLGSILAVDDKTAAEASVPEGSMTVQNTMMVGNGAATPFRLCQDGIFFVAPFLGRQVVYASGAECAKILSFMGQQVIPEAAYGKRLTAALKTVNPGSVLIVCAPALDGFEASEAAYPHHPEFDPENADPAVQPAALREFYDAVQLDKTGGFAFPKQHVPISAERAIPPLYRVHYTHSADGASLVYQPELRVYPGINPLARLVTTLWKGKNKVGLMVPTESVELLQSVLAAGGYSRRTTA